MARSSVIRAARKVKAKAKKTAVLQKPLRNSEPVSEPISAVLRTKRRPGYEAPPKPPPQARVKTLEQGKDPKPEDRSASSATEPFWRSERFIKALRAHQQQPPEYHEAVFAATQARAKARDRGIDPRVGIENSPDPKLHVPPELEGGPVGGVPPAFSVFPRLELFPRFRPRRFRELPIGNTEKPSVVGVQRALQHLYHDLGVLVWDGCNARQIGQLGRIIEQTLGMGGPGKMIAFLRTVSSQHGMVWMNLRNLKVLPSIDEKRTGLLAPVTSIQIANWALRDIMKLRQDVIAAKGVTRFPLETQVEVSGTPPARGIIHSTVLNPRYHQRVVSYSSLRVDPVYGRVVGTVELYTVGSAEFLGHVKIYYTILQKTPSANVAVPVWGNRIIQETPLPSKDVQEQSAKMIVSQILRPMWELEREIWADRAQAMEKHIAERNKRVAEENKARRKARAEELDRQWLEKERRREKNERVNKKARAKRKTQILNYLDKRRVVHDKEKKGRAEPAKERRRSIPKRKDGDPVLKMLKNPMNKPDKYGSNKRR